MMLAAIRKKVLEGERISPAEGLFLMREADLLDLAPLANAWRDRYNPDPVVTFVVDTNLNYTNVCDAYCTFCAFYRPDPSDPSAYTYTVDQMMEKIGRAAAKGVTTVLLQGGLNSALPLEYYVDLVRETRRRYPQVTPHYFSAPEIMKMVQVSEKSVREVITALKEAGQRTMPGGGSEILSDRVKKQVSSLAPKSRVSDWTEVHREAHRQGWMTTATMMYGHVESDEDIIESLLHIRDVQDDALAPSTARGALDPRPSRRVGIEGAASSAVRRHARHAPGGFTAFIPWSYKRANTALARRVKEEAGPNRYLRIIAASRIFLDNVPHIQASWFSEGKKTGQVALHFGADDFGGTLFDENVMLAAGFYNRTTIDEIKHLIAEAGFAPAQRTTEYQILERFRPERPDRQSAGRPAISEPHAVR